MKRVLKFSLLVSATLSALMTASAFAETASTLMVSINKKVPAAEAEAYARKLERIDPSMGECFFNAKLVEYVPYDGDPLYHGVAIVDVKENCSAPALDAYICELKLREQEGIYTIYSNPIIDPHPGMAGRN